MKVYFGADDGAVQILWASNVQYILISFFHHPVWNEKQVALLRKYKHVMTDSGLFTFMFGAEAGTPMPWEFCTGWQLKYIDYLKKYYRPTDTAIELDVQKKLGVEAAWELRKMLRAAIPNPIINVYHLEDGNPDKLIEYSDYIAISQPELRKNVTPSERERITSYISGKALAKGKKVHLLGLTQLDYMKKYRHCTSCDSTSWQSHFRWGGDATDTWRIKKEVIKNQKNIGAANAMYKVDRYWNGLFFLEEYKRYAGDQA